MQAPPPNPQHRTRVLVAYCAKCRQLGEIRGIEERYTGQYDEFLRGTKPMPMSPAVIEASMALVAARKAWTSQ